MLLPDAYSWLEPVIVAAIVLFIVDLIGNSIAYGGRFINAIATAIVFFIIFAALAYFGLGKLAVSSEYAQIPSRFMPDDLVWLEPVLIATALVLIVGFIGNVLAFKNRFINAVVTALIFLVVFGAVTYFGYGAVEVSLPSISSGDVPAGE